MASAPTDEMHFRRREVLGAAAVAAMLAAAPARGAIGGRPVVRGHAFIVGNNRYRTIDPLRRASADASAVADRLASFGYRTFTLAAELRERVELLTSGEQTPQLFATPRAQQRGFIATTGRACLAGSARPGF